MLDMQYKYIPVPPYLVHIVKTVNKIYVKLVCEILICLIICEEFINAYSAGHMPKIK